MGANGYREAGKWLRGVDLNHRPLGYEPNELPDCSTPQLNDTSGVMAGQTTAACVGLSRQIARKIFSAPLLRSASRSQAVA